MKTSTLLALFTCFSIGIVSGFISGFNSAIIAFVFLVGGALILYGGWTRSRSVLFVSLFILLAGVGIARVHIVHISERDAALDKSIKTTIHVRGFIADEPDVREGHTILTVAPEVLIEKDGSEIKIEHSDKSKIRMFVEPHPEWSYGDEVDVSGKIQEPENFKSDTGRTFQYIPYLAKDGIFYEIYRPDIKLIKTGGGNTVVHGLFEMKHALLVHMNKILPGPEGALAGGITLGAKSSLGEDMLDQFRVAGIVHVVVLSGYNVTIIADSIMRVLGFLPRVISLTAGSLGVILFAVMTGAGATVVRASIMALLVVVARATGRSHEVGRILLLVAWVMILWNPYILVYDPSFQLSFLATLGLIYLTPLFERVFTRIPEWFSLRSIAAATVGAQIAVLPLLLYQSGLFSTVALLVNMLVLPLVPLSMLVSFIATLVAFAGVVPAMPFGFIAYLLLGYMFLIVHIFASLPLASFVVPQFPFWGVIAMYLGIAWITAHTYDRHRKKRINVFARDPQLP